MDSQLVAANRSQVFGDAGRVRDRGRASMRIRADKPRHERPRADVIANVPNQRTSRRTRPRRQHVHLEAIAVDQIRCESRQCPAQAMQVCDARNSRASHVANQSQMTLLPAGGAAGARVAQT